MIPFKHIREKPAAKNRGPEGPQAGDGLGLKTSTYHIENGKMDLTPISYETWRGRPRMICILSITIS